MASENHQELVDIQRDSIISRTIFEDRTVEVLLFGFAANQSLSEHTGSGAAILQVVSGDVQLTLGDDTCEVRGGRRLQMPPHLPYGVVAKTDALMLLYMLKGCRK